MANHPNRAVKTEDEENLPATTGTALEVVDFGGDEAAGFEDTRIEELTTPFINIAQGLSPELNPGKAEHIPGLALGMMFNTAIRQPMAGTPGISAIVCWKHYHYGLWIPRPLGGGFRGPLAPEHPLVQATKRRMAAKYGPSGARFRLPRYDGKLGRWTDEPPRSPDTDEAVEMIETANLYIMYSQLPERVDEMNARYALIRFTSTKLTPYSGYVTAHKDRKWRLADGRSVEAPIYAYRWVISVVPDNRGSDKEFFNWKLALDNVTGNGDPYRGALISRVDDPIYPLAKQFHDQAKGNLIVPDYKAAGVAVDDDAPPF